MKTTILRRSASRFSPLLALVSLLGAASCFRSLDSSKIPCTTASQCPQGYSCDRLLGADRGHCTVDTSDGSSSGHDGPAGTGGLAAGDVAQGGSGGRSDAYTDGAVGGAAGDAGGATGGAGGAAGDAGGAADAPIGTGGTTSTPDAPLVTTDAGLGKGAACTDKGQCASSFCVDGVCCDKACGECNACSNAMTGEADGTCAPVAVGKDPHEACADETASKPCGNDGTCDGKGACRKVGAGQKCGAASCSSDGITFTPEAKCDGNGTCSAGTPQVCTPYDCAVTGCKKTCTTQEQCDTGTYCDVTAGTCATKKTNGKPATQTYECESAIVADGVCCDKECTGCSACTAALNGQAATTTGSCLAVTAAKAADPHAACPVASDPCGTDGTCNGTGACHYAAAGSDCGTPSCNATTSMLTKSTCSSSHVCTAGSPTACAGSLTCASATVCKTGTCTGNADCASGYTCLSGACSQTLPAGTACTSSNQCSSKACVDGHCCGQASCGTCQACTGTGGTCVAVTSAEDPDSCSGTSSCNATGVCKKKQGQACSAATDCGTGFCADGVCCDRACSGSCEFCNNTSSPGTCGYVSGAPKSGHTACTGSGACQGTCDGTKATCSMPGAEVSCRAASCDSTTNVQTNAASCNGTGTCPTLSTYACSPSKCGATSCQTSCSTSSQCVTGAACIGGACQMCSTGQMVCGNACATTSSDPNHCGNCTTVCGGTTPYCQSGQCSQCRTIADCSGYQACDTATHTCVCKQKSSGNRLQTPGFDSADALGSWQSTSPLASAAYSTDDADGCVGSGSASIPGFANLWQCLPSIGPGVPYVFGFKHKGIVTCSATFYSDNSCNTYIDTVNLDDTSGASSWDGMLQARGNTPATTQSVEVFCSGSAGAGFIDQAYFNTSGGTF